MKESLVSAVRMFKMKRRFKESSSKAELQLSAC